MVSLGCSGSAKLPERSEPEDAAQAAMTAYDNNSDGKLDAKELKSCLSIASEIRKIDTNRDKVVSQDEIQKRLEVLKNGSIYVDTSLVVTSKRNPVAGATVRLVPEEFLGSGFQAFSGTTNDNGMVIVEGEENPSVPGVLAGFYSVIITTAEGKEFKRGCEVSDDAGNRLSFSL